MSDTPLPATGRFVWHEIMTPDPAATRRYYTELFGWTTSENDMGAHGPYTMFHVGEPALAGMMQKTPDMHFPTHWGSYVTVDSVDAATERARELGATVAVPPMDIPNVGRFSCIVDPQGAVIYPFTFTGENPPEPTSPLPNGMVSWVELHSPDPEAAVDFYSKVVGWGHRRQDMGPMGAYDLLTRGGKDTAGILRMPANAQGPAQWLVYVLVPDVDAAVTKAESMGGKIWVRGVDIPGVGRIGVHSDPFGAMIAFHRPAM